jgi:transcriptional regulator with XRE-family HTH domain
VTTNEVIKTTESGADGRFGHRKLEVRHSAKLPGTVDASRQWVEFGRWIAEQRELKGLQQREAARLADLPEEVWAELETGRADAIGGIRLLPNPSSEVLKKMAQVLGVPVGELIARTGGVSTARPRNRDTQVRPQSYRQSVPEDDTATLVAKIRRLSEHDQIVVARLVDVMLENRDD